MEKISFTDPDTNECLEFFVLEQTAIGGCSYLLVTLDEKGDSDALVLREKEQENEQTAVYEIVEDEKELALIAPIFEELLEDVAIEL
ncbi:MAG: DUF1292 domain-containing protein [Lachnospiraceae bacterium]|nr:DUF1292 domain-containing protein [Lachnospiraceae bacterium]